MPAAEQTLSTITLPVDLARDLEKADYHRVRAEHPHTPLVFMLTLTQLSIPVESGEMMLGTWQGIYLFEHRAGPHRRSVVLHLIANG